MHPLKKTQPLHCIVGALSVSPGLMPSQEEICRMFVDFPINEIREACLRALLIREGESGLGPVFRWFQRQASLLYVAGDPFVKNVIQAYAENVSGKEKIVEFLKFVVGLEYVPGYAGWVEPIFFRQKVGCVDVCIRRNKDVWDPEWYREHLSDFMSPFFRKCLMPLRSVEKYEASDWECAKLAISIISVMKDMTCLDIVRDIDAAFTQYYDGREQGVPTGTGREEPFEGRREFLALTSLAIFELKKELEADL